MSDKEIKLLEKQKEQNKQLQQQVSKRYKSFGYLLLVVINLGMSTFYFGYSLTQFSSIDIETIIGIYKISWGKTLAQGMLNGCIPIGAGFGAIFSHLLIKKLSRRNCILFVNGVAFIAGILIFIENSILLLILRLVQGICTGIFSSITPLLIKQISPTQISGTLGAVNQFFLAFGIFFSFFFQYILSKSAGNPSGDLIWRYVFGLPLIIIFVQTIILIFIFPYQTPKYLLINGKQEQAKKLLQVFYQKQYLNKVLQQKKADIFNVINETEEQILNKVQQIQISQRKSWTSINKSEQGKQQMRQNFSTNLQQNNKKASKKNKTTRIAIFMALHLALLQQFVGINAVVPYGGEIAGEAIPSLKQIFPIIINLEQTLTCFLTSYLLSKIGRKTILQLGTAIGAFSNAIIAIGLFIKSSNSDVGSGLILFGLVIFMANFGLSLGPVIWLYIPQIVQPQIVPYSTLMNWAGASFVMFLFPIIKQALPNNNPSSIFIFFSVWCIGSFFLNSQYLVQTRGKTEKEIKQSFKKE